MKPFVILGLAGLVAGAFVLRRRKSPSRAARVQARAEQAIHDIEERARELQKQAKHYSGEARQRLQEQAHEMEAQQKELRKRLDDVNGDAHKLLEKARGKVHAAA